MSRHRALHEQGGPGHDPDQPDRSDDRPDDREVLTGTVIEPAGPAPSSSSSSSAGSDEPAPVVHGVMGPATRQVTCPGCGKEHHISLARQESEDFCPTRLADGTRCDYPLFFVALGRPETHEDGTATRALGRSAGVLGRADDKAIRCPWPHCGEPNAGSRTSCHRCHKPLHPPTSRPEPAPAAAPAPATLPTPEPPEPDASTPWWWLALVLLTFALLVAIVGYAVFRGR